MSYLTQEQSDWVWFSCQLHSLHLSDDALSHYIDVLKTACYGSITSSLDEKKKLNETLNETYGNDNVEGEK